MEFFAENFRILYDQDYLSDLTKDFERSNLIEVAYETPDGLGASDWQIDTSELTYCDLDEYMEQGIENTEANSQDQINSDETEKLIEEFYDKLVQFETTRNFADRNEQEKKRKTKSTSDEQRNSTKKPIRSKRKISQLWRFILDLLDNQETDPTLIQWISREQGKFKLNNREKVAQLWGQKKNNIKMNYKTMSRAMRHYYAANILVPVYGRKMIYQFSQDFINNFNLNKTQ